MKLVKTTLFSAVITFIRIASGFVAGKAVALFTGTSGVALIGAFTNFINIVLSFGNGAISSGVIKYTAEYNEDDDSLKKLFSTAFKISVVCSAIIGVILLSLASLISSLIFTSDQYANPIRVLGLTVVLYSLNSLLISILNGRGQIKTYTIVNTVGSIIGLVFTVTLVYFFKINGALYALVLAQSIVFFVTAVLVTRSPWFQWSFFEQPFDRVFALKLSHYSVMAIVTSLTVPVAQIVLRNMIINKLGIDAAGQWQGMMRVSDGYLMLITTALGTYYLPKLSSLKIDSEIRNEIFKGYKIILPLVIIGCFAIYFLRFFIIQTLYTPAFSKMESLFLWQLVGDFFKMASWMLAYLMLAKSMTTIYILTEILFNILYLFLGFLFVDMYGLNGVAIAFSINYFAYFLVMLFIFRKLLCNRSVTN